MDKITIMMSSYNGEKYIEEQINSILNQKNVQVMLYVRDDGSTDSTQSILDRYQAQGKLKWYTGENLRPAKSFMDLVNHVPLETEYYAFSDQDDFWLENKMYEAVNILKQWSDDKPCLYYGWAKMVDKDLKPIDQRPASYISDTMKKTIISSGCTGCTMCFNKKLMEYLRVTEYKYDLMHDNWIHKVCTAIGGNLYYDRTPYMLYRQHGNNAIGGKSTFINRMKRHMETIYKNRCYRSKSIDAIYYVYNKYMPDENKKICEQILNYHKGIERFKIIFDRQYRLGDKRLDTIFIGAVLLGVF